MEEFRRPPADPALRVWELGPMSAWRTTARDMTGSAPEAVADASVVAHIRERIHG